MNNSDALWISSDKRMTSLILASASPQRKLLLEGLGIVFEVVVSSVDEDIHPEKDPKKRAVTLARLKAENVKKSNPDAIVIGCDTLVVAPDETLLEKPASQEEARKMLMLQNDNTSLVHSAACVIDANGRAHEGLSSSAVTFKKLSPEDIDWWIGTDLWKDRSGAFQIDGFGQLMISKLEGDWTGVVGLPVYVLGGLLREVGIKV
jgi:septum formation protein